MLHHPTGLASVDIAAELTAALTMRMKPPPDPPADLNLSTGGWLLMSVVGGFTWLVAIFSDERLLPFVAVLGTFLLAFGYFWAAYLAGLHNWVRGVVTLLPPVALWRICLPFGDNGYRPLRFVLTGALFLALYWVGPLASAALQPVWAMLEIARPERSNTVVISPADRLKTAVQSNQPENVISLLADFASPDLIAATSADEKTALIAEIKKLTRTDETDRSEVRVNAINTLAMWSPKETRLAVLVALFLTIIHRIDPSNQFGTRSAGQGPDIVKPDLGVGPQAHRPATALVRIVHAPVVAVTPCKGHQVQTTPVIDATSSGLQCLEGPFVFDFL